MDISRRSLLAGLGGLSAVSLPALAGATEEVSTSAPLLPDKESFPIQGVYLNAAYTHPLGSAAYESAERYLASRVRQGLPADNPRDAAVALYAKLINAEPAEITVVPSTMVGENLIASAVGLDKSAGVVTDALHFDPSLVLYGELNRRGVPLSVVAPRSLRVELADVEAAISKTTRLIAISLVASKTGFTHDLKALCDLAHSHNVLVYADMIQAAGAMPIDVKESGVDFCCSGTYKFLMGDFGLAFLYVRADRLQSLERVQVGWRQVRNKTSHVLPFEPAGPPLGSWTLGTDTAGLFEVSNAAWPSLAVVVGSLNYIRSVGVRAIAAHRQPLIDRLQDELPRHGFLPLTPRGSPGPIVSFAYRGSAQRFDKKLAAAKVKISTYENRIRLSPSVYNNMEDVNKVISLLIK
jgi:selenocysteine lyase/cysteine desulfurase